MSAILCGVVVVFCCVEVLLQFFSGSTLENVDELPLLDVINFFVLTHCQWAFALS